MDSRCKIDITTLMDVVDAIRHDRWMTWVEVAQEVGISPAHISNMRTGRQTDTQSSILLSILRWLSMPPMELGILVQQITIHKEI
jgi:DNA-binding Xre family transcriptional regulator